MSRLSKILINIIENNIFRPKRSPAPVSVGPASSAEAVSKFGNAKSISSDMFFGGESNSERDANLSRSVLVKIPT